MEGSGPHPVADPFVAVLFRDDYRREKRPSLDPFISPPMLPVYGRRNVFRGLFSAKCEVG